MLRQTLIPACGALVTFGPLHERLELDRESVDLSNRAHDRVQAQRGHLRMVFDYAELGDLAGLDASIRTYEEGARGFRQPQYQWPALMLRAMRAQMAGRFAECEQLAGEVKEIGERNRDFNAVFTAQMHLLARLYVGELHAELLALEATVRPTLLRI